MNRHTPVCGLLKFISSVTRQKSRNMDKLKRNYDDYSQQRSNCSTLTVLQWNVLADGLAQNGDFQRVSAFSFRHSLVRDSESIYYISRAV